MTTTTTDRAARALAAVGYATGTVAGEPPTGPTGPSGRSGPGGLTRSADWATFAAGWERLPRDRHMADGGTYRRRRFAELVLETTTGRCTRLPHRSFSQPRDLNRLNGGVERWFAPIEDEVVEGPVLRELLLWFARRLDEAEGRATGARWLAQCFQNRTLARPGRPGLPTPEGIHRDGMDYNAILLVDRRGVDGGTNTVYTPDREPLERVLLAHPGDYLVTDDRALLHDATLVTLAAGARAGHRDVLVTSFTRRRGTA